MADADPAGERERLRRRRPALLRWDVLRERDKTVLDSSVTNDRRLLQCGEGRA